MASLWGIPSEAKIRKAQAADASDAWDIRNAAILNGCAGHYPADLLKTWTDGEMTERSVQLVAENFHVATLDEIVVATGVIDLSTGQLDAIFVRPDKMGLGRGKRMTAYLEDLAIREGLTELRLDSTLNAAPFYRICGFEGDAIGQYQSPRGIMLDCIPMTKRLPPSR